jgi:hypothetical protein
MLHLADSAAILAPADAGRQRVSQYLPVGLLFSEHPISFFLAPVFSRFVSSISLNFLASFSHFFGQRLFNLLPPRGCEVGSSGSLETSTTTRQRDTRDSATGRLYETRPVRRSHNSYCRALGSVRLALRRTVQTGGPERRRQLADLSLRFATNRVESE